MTDQPDTAGMPTWLRGAVLLGVPSIIALFLVYTLTSQVQGAVSEIQRTQALQAQALREMQTIIHTRLQDVNIDRRQFTETALRLERLIQRTCLTAAHTADQRASCLNGHGQIR